MTVLAQTTEWPEASIAIFGILFVTVLTTAVVWQLFSTAKARFSLARESAYKKLAEDAVTAQTLTSQELAKTRAELEEIRRRTGELERLLKEVG